MDSQQKGFFDSMKPKSAFVAGLASGAGVLFTIGFFIMLSMVMSGDGISFGQKNAGGAAAAVNNAGSPTAPSGPTEIVLAEATDDDWVRGDEDAAITIVEFSDISCPFCERFHSTMNQVMEEYEGDVKWVYRHFPLRSLHPNAAKQAEAAECVGELGGNDAFWAFLDVMFSPENANLPMAQIGDKAASVGVNKTKFQSCLDSGKYAGKVSEQEQQAVSAGGQGTPYSVIMIGDQKVPVSGAFPIEQLRAMIDPLL